MGGKIAVAKSFIFSRCPDIRTWLKTYYWPTIGACLRICTNFRDLGAHANVSCRNVGATLTDRINNAVRVVTKIRRLPHAYATKVHFILTRVLSGGLYGCEATFANECALNKLATTIASTIAHTTPRCTRTPWIKTRSGTHRLHIPSQSHHLQENASQKSNHRRSCQGDS